MIYFTSIKIKYSSNKECIFFLSNIDLKSMMKTSCSILPSCMMTRSGLCEWHNWKFLTEACNIGTLSQCTVWNYRVIFVISQCPSSSDQSSQIEAPLTTFVKVTYRCGANWLTPSTCLLCIFLCRWRHKGQYNSCLSTESSTYIYLKCSHSAGTD